MIMLKRVYDQPSPEDGCRILVDRLWPRGISKEKAAIDHWMKDVAPSPELRKWFSHDPAKWDEFQEHYQAELESNSALAELIALIRHKDVTLIYAAHDQEHNAAIVLKNYLDDRL